MDDIDVGMFFEAWGVFFAVFFIVLKDPQDQGFAGEKVCKKTFAVPIP